MTEKNYFPTKAEIHSAFLGGDLKRAEFMDKFAQEVNPDNLSTIFSYLMSEDEKNPKGPSSELQLACMLKTFSGFTFDWGHKTISWNNHKFWDLPPLCT